MEIRGGGEVFTIQDCGLREDLQFKAASLVYLLWRPTQLVRIAMYTRVAPNPQLYEGTPFGNPPAIPPPRPPWRR